MTVCWTETCGIKTDIKKSCCLYSMWYSFGETSLQNNQETEMYNNEGTLQKWG